MTISFLGVYFKPNHGGCYYYKSDFGLYLGSTVSKTQDACQQSVTNEGLDCWGFPDPKNVYNIYIYIYIYILYNFYIYIYLIYYILSLHVYIYIILVGDEVSHPGGSLGGGVYRSNLCHYTRLWLSIAKWVCLAAGRSLVQIMKNSKVWKNLGVRILKC